MYRIEMQLLYHCVKVLDGLRKFGESDDLYSLLTEYQISPWESWTIEQKVMHAPGNVYSNVV